MTYLNFIAAGLAAFGIALNLFQSFINIPFIGRAGLLDILNLLFNGFIPVTGNSDIPSSLSLGIIFLVSIPVLAVIGVVKAIQKKGGYFFLAVSAIECIIFALYLKLFVSSAGREYGSDFGMMASLLVSSFVPVVWGLFYAAACACAYIASGKNIDVSKFSRFDTINDKAKEIYTTLKIKIPIHAKVKTEKVIVPPAKNNPAINYEAMSLKEMIKEGLTALGRSEFTKADEFFNHALIRKSDSANALIGKLMAKYKARNANELVNAPVLLETEEFFQKALLSASPKMREILDKYIRVNRLKRGSSVKHA